MALAMGGDFFLKKTARNIVSALAKERQPMDIYLAVLYFLLY